MVDSGYVTPVGNLVVKGRPTNVTFRNLGVVTNGYPGRLCVREATDYDVKVSDGLLPPQGWIGYEQQAIQYQVGNITTINVVDTEVPVLKGGGFTIYMPSGLAAGTVAAQGDPLLSWIDGQVVPGGNFSGQVGIKIPFAKNTSETSTLKLPAGVVVRNVIVQVTTAASSGTIDIGTLSTDSGDADGFIDGESCAAAGFVVHDLANTTAGSITLGALLKESNLLDATVAGAITFAQTTNYLVPAGGKTITYTTSNHTIAGYFYVLVDSPGIVKVGTSGTAVDASSAAAGVFVETAI
jgi:hypothetical protein